MLQGFSEVHGLYVQRFADLSMGLVSRAGRERESLLCREI